MLLEINEKTIEKIKKTMPSGSYVRIYVASCG